MKKNKLCKGIAKALLVGCLFMTWGGGYAAAADQTIIIRKDVEAAQVGPKLPKNFRVIDAIKASGSSEFNGDQLSKVKAALAGKKVVIVDLRQESHGFANNQVSLSWFGFRNWANKGKSEGDIKEDEKAKLAGILKQKNITIHDELEKDDATGALISTKPEPLTVNSVITEKELVKKMGMDYERFTVTDHCRPTDEQVDDFIEFAQDAMESGEWLHFHCEAGKGRTTTFLAMYDMMQNAKKMTCQDILNRQKNAGGSDLLEIDTGWKAQVSAEKAEFIKKFYEYCRTNNDDFKTSWSDWVKKQNNKKELKCAS